MLEKAPQLEPQTLLSGDSENWSGALHH
jgi:hypothetical protein